MADWLDDVVAPRESGGRPNIGWRNTDLTPWLQAGKTVYGFPDWPGLPGPAGISTAAGLYGITKTNWKNLAPRLGVNDFSPASQRKVADALMATQGPSAWAASEPGYKSGLRRTPPGSVSEGYYDGSLHVTLRPEQKTPFPIDAALDALLGGTPMGEAEGGGHPLMMLDSLISPPQEGAQQPLPVSDYIEPPGAEPQSSAALESAADLAPATMRQLPALGGEAPPRAAPPSPEGPSQLLNQLLGETIEPPAAGQAAGQSPPAAPTGQAAPTPQSSVDVGTGIPLSLDRSPAQMPPDTLLDHILSGASDIAQGLGGLAERARLGALNTLKAPGQLKTGDEPLRAEVPLERGARAGEGLATFATGGLLSPVGAEIRQAAAAARPVARAAAEVSRETSAAMPALMADVRGGVAPPAGAIPPAPVPKAGGVAGLVQSVKDTVNATIRDVQIKAVPMAAGDDAGRAIAKDYANSERLARYRRSKWDTELRKLSPQDQRAMWEAMDNASVAAQSIGGKAGIEAGMRYIRMLPAGQQRLLMDMEKKGIEFWESARDAGLVQESAERLPFYIMRGVVEIGDDGGIARLSPSRGPGLSALDQFGVNLTTRGPMARAHLTAAETEAAAQKLTENAEIVRNIRVLPLAYERFEKAIAGRRLINDLKEIGEATGKPAVAEGEQLGQGWFTLDHPAFKTYRPRMAEADGKVAPLRGPDGKIVFDKVPLYVSRQFEGPLRSVMRHESGAFYSAVMMAKAGAMATIMNSPVIHNAVEWGRALGAMPGKVATFQVYRIGAQALANPRLMERAIKDGLVPIGERGYMQDIEGIASAADLQPGRGLLAKGLGALTDVVSPKAGEAVRRGIDRAGDVWHQKLLWDQVAKLQAGLYNEFARDLIKKGVDRDTASKMAAHFANRFAGAVPNEAMSEGAKKALNFVLFSRSFTTGNLGVMKDMVNGLPRDVRAQMGRNLTELERKAAGSLARRKAIGTVMADIGIMYLSNAILQTGIEALAGDRDLGQMGQDYADRMGNLMQRTQESPLDLLNPLHDVEMLRSLSPLSGNEPGKQERVLLGHKADGTAVYIRSPVGKIGEEFEGWATRPLEMLKNKEGTVVRPLLNVLNNDRGFGGRVERVYNQNPRGLGEHAGVVGSILWEFMRSQTPDLQLRAAYRLMTGRGDWVDAAQMAAPFAGFTVSRGAPGGEAVGELYQAKGEHDARVRAALPDVRDLVQREKYDEAQQKLEQLGVPRQLQRYYLKTYGAPESRLSPRAMRDFQRYATPEQKRRMEMQMRRRDEREPRPSVGGP